MNHETSNLLPEWYIERRQLRRDTLVGLSVEVAIVLILVMTNISLEAYRQDHEQMLADVKARVQERSVSAEPTIKTIGDYNAVVGQVLNWQQKIEGISRFIAPLYVLRPDGHDVFISSIDYDNTGYRITGYGTNITKISDYFADVKREVPEAGIRMGPNKNIDGVEYKSFMVVVP